MIGLGLGAATLGVGLTIYLKDNFSAPAAAVQNRIQALAATGTNTVKQNYNLIRNVSGGIALAGGLALRAIKTATDEASEFDNVIINTGAIAGATTKQIQSLRASVRDLSGQFPFSSKEISESLRELAYAGVPIEDLNKMHRSVLLMAQTAGIPAKDAAENLIHMMAMYNMSATQAPRAVDVLVQAANKTTASMAQIAEGFKYSGTWAHTLGLTFEELTASIAMLNQVGFTGSNAGIVLGNTLQYAAKALGRPSKLQAHALASLGLSPRDLMDAKGNLLPILTVFDKLRNGLNHIHGNVFKTVTLFDLFGRRGGRIGSLINLLDGSKMGSSFSELLNNLNKHSEGSALELFNKNMTSYLNKTILLKNAWLNFKIALFDALKPALGIIVQGLTALAKLLRWIVETPVGKWATVFTIGFVGIATAVAGVTAVVMQLKLALMGLGALGTGKGLLFALTNKIPSGAANAAANVISQISLRNRLLQALAPGNDTRQMFANGIMWLRNPFSTVPGAIVRSTTVMGTFIRAMLGASGAIRLFLGPWGLVITGLLLVTGWWRPIVDLMKSLYHALGSFIHTITFGMINLPGYHSDYEIYNHENFKKRGYISQGDYAYETKYANNSITQSLGAAARRYSQQNPEVNVNTKIYMDGRESIKKLVKNEQDNEMVQYHTIQY